MTKANLKNATEVDVLDFNKTTDFANLKSGVDKLDIDKLNNVPNRLSSLKSKVEKFYIGKSETTPVYLSKVSNLVKKDVVKKTEYIELVKNGSNISTIDTSYSVKKLTVTQKSLKLKIK